jgi:ATP-binding cassette subfamily B protein
MVYVKARETRDVDPRLTSGGLRLLSLIGLFRERWQLVRLLSSEGGRWGLTGLMLSLTVVAVSAPVQALMTGWMVREVAADRSPGILLTPLVLLVCTLFLRQLGESTGDFFNTTVATRIDGSTRRRVRRIALGPVGITHLENQEFHNDVLRACDLGEVWRIRSAGTAATGQAVLMSRVLGAMAAAAVLALHFPILAVGLFLASLVMRAGLRRQWMYLAALDDSHVTDQRRAEYWAELVAGPGAAKEIRLFGLAQWALDRRLRTHLVWSRLRSAALRSVLRRQGLTTCVAGGSALAALLVPGLSAMAGRIDAGTLAACLVAAWGVMQMSAMGHEAFDIDYGIGAVRAVERLRGAHGEGLPARHPLPATDGPPLVRFEHVSFTYPGASRPVLDDFCLELRPGEVVGLVGHNGVGKTTLAKLLGGLYRPTAGRITVAGVDLAELDAAEWRRHLAVIFQDFIHYATTVRDNVALSAPESLHDEEAVRAALRAAGAEEMIAAMPEGVETRLWRGGAGGMDMSGGQWQKLAIARALFAVKQGRQVLVLDEPTAHLDVRAEAEFYNRVVAALPQTSILLASHRLSTVRNADRIVVLDEGKVKETGTHDELLETGGEYARLFALQAARFAGATRAESRLDAVEGVQ